MINIKEIHRRMSKDKPTNLYFFMGSLFLIAGLVSLFLYVGFFNDLYYINLENAISNIVMNLSVATLFLILGRRKKEIKIEEEIKVYEVKPKFKE